LIESVRRQSRTGLWVVIAVLVVVGTFWALRIAQSQRFQTYVREVRLKQRLRAIKPPPGARVENISTFHLESIVVGTGLYSSDLEFDKVKSHYLGEFARHGFVYKGDTVQDSQVQVNFCTPDYHATVSPTLEARSRRYIIFIRWTSDPC
jgi:hypothetical protein